MLISSKGVSSLQYYYSVKEPVNEEPVFKVTEKYKDEESPSDLYSQDDIYSSLRLLYGSVSKL